MIYTHNILKWIDTIVLSKQDTRFLLQDYYNRNNSKQYSWCVQLLEKIFFSAPLPNYVLMT